MDEEFVLGEEPEGAGGEEGGESQLVTVDLSRAALIPPDGVYELLCVQAAFRMSKANNPMVLVGWEVSVDDDHDGEYEGCFVHDNLMLRGGRAGMAADAVQGLLGYLPEPGWDPGILVGNTILARLKVGKDQEGRPQAQVQAYLP